MKKTWGSGGTAPRFPNIGSRRRWVVSFYSSSLPTSPEAQPPGNKFLEILESSEGWSGETKIPWPFWNSTVECPQPSHYLDWSVQAQLLSGYQFFKVKYPSAMLLVCHIIHIPRLPQISPMRRDLSWEDDVTQAVGIHPAFL